MTASDANQRAFDAAYAELRDSRVAADEESRSEVARNLVTALRGTSHMYGLDCLRRMSQGPATALRAEVIAEWGTAWLHDLSVSELDAAVAAAARVLAEEGQ